jgi:small multidrug resistance family-3 protein
MTNVLVFMGAAVAEIAGCFAFWAWIRMGYSVAWLAPGLASLALFAYLLTQVESDFAGRAYAAYGGVYVAASLIWLWAIEGAKPDIWDILGAVVCLLGMAIILFAPRPG